MLPLIFINKIKINNMENKQETLKEFFDTIVLIKELTIDELLKEYSKNLTESEVKILNNKINIKQETLEEAASRLLYNKYPYHPPQDSGYWKDMFIEGAKWQAKRMEEILRKAYFNRTDDIDVDGYWISDPEKDLEMLIEQFKKQ